MSMNETPRNKENKQDINIIWLRLIHTYFAICLVSDYTHD